MALYCYPVGLHEWPTDAVSVERFPLGRATGGVRSSTWLCSAAGRSAASWCSRPRGSATRCSGSRHARKQAWSNVRTRTARRTHGVEELQILVDAHEQYADRFAIQQASTVERALPCGDHGLVVDGVADSR